MLPSDRLRESVFPHRARRDPAVGQERENTAFLDFLITPEEDAQRRTMRYALKRLLEKARPTLSVGAQHLIEDLPSATSREFCDASSTSAASALEAARMTLPAFFVATRHHRSRWPALGLLPEGCTSAVTVPNTFIATTEANISGRDRFPSDLIVRHH